MCRCGNVIEEHPDERHYIEGKYVCNDCYCGGLGELVESRAIPSPKR